MHISAPLIFSIEGFWPLLVEQNFFPLFRYFNSLNRLICLKILTKYFHKLKIEATKQDRYVNEFKFTHAGRFRPSQHNKLV